jgi:hypothetical protein
VRVVRLERERPFERRGRLVRVPGRERRAPEERVRGGEVRRELEGLAGEVGGGAVVALLVGRAGIAVAAVGQEVAGGSEGLQHRGSMAETAGRCQSATAPPSKAARIGP